MFRWGMLRFYGDTHFLEADSRLTLLGESIADLLEILCLVRAAGRLAARESIVESCLTRRGVKVSGLRSSVEPTLIPWWTEQLDRLDNSILPLFLWEKIPVEALDDCRLTNLLLVGK